MKSFVNYFPSFQVFAIFFLLILNYRFVKSQIESAEIFGSLRPNQDVKYNGTAKSNKNNSTKDLSMDPAITHPFSSLQNHARIPSLFYNLFNPGLARRVSLSTLILSSLLYSLTILPALFTVTGYDPFGGVGIIPLVLPGIIGGLAGRKKRSTNHKIYRILRKRSVLKVSKRIKAQKKRVYHYS